MEEIFPFLRDANRGQALDKFTFKILILLAVSMVAFCKQRY